MLPPAIHRFVAVGIGLALPFLATLADQLLFPKFHHYLKILAVVYLFAGALMGAIHRAGPWNWVIAVYALLPFGAFVDESIHLNLNGEVYDRNMIPFEILVFMVVAPVPLIVGCQSARLLLGYAASNRKSNAT
jgi:hypothetical protein